ncbi:hypothetical protein K6U06_06335 [Acidiferrimicrobium sp. IK]|uniref:hypothetical protein n=1 Tax=Acidiferrimicrobium sp. IK TaxID=2871700 RepID=UPI0021CB3573|nr:hypothetical protein [Acidiferrimicrobium sp. IK]MCU4183970.1 hypothetical protein [Acidiferrimicrobium sp. IK]
MFRHHADRPDPALQAARAEAESLLGRLSHDVSTLDDGGDPTNRQALADAAERYNTAGAQMGEATTVGEINVVRNIAIEGLHSTRLVRTRLGLDPGPEPAAIPVTPPPAELPQQPAWGGRRSGNGLGGALGAGLAGGLLGMLGGEVLGEVFDGDQGGGDWGGGGGWGGDNDGGGW